LCTQAVEATTHAGHTSGDPCSRFGAELDQVRKLFRTDLNSSASAPRSALIPSLDSPIEIAAADSQTASRELLTR
jgi:hypothetical protein